MKKIHVFIFALIASAIGVYFYTNKDDAKDVPAFDLPTHVNGAELQALRKPLVCKEGTIMEVFAYQCPHCFKLEAHLDQITKAGKWFLKVPTDLGRKAFRPYLKMNYAVDVLGMDKGLKHEAMRLYHENGQQFSSDSAVIAWLIQNGAKKQMVVDLFASKELEDKILFSNNFLRKTGVTSVPTLIINGRYKTSPMHAGGYDRLAAQVEELLRLPHTCKSNEVASK